MIGRGAIPDSPEMFDPSPFDLDLRYGVRTVRNLEFVFLMFSRASFAGQLLSLVGLTLIAIRFGNRTVSVRSLLSWEVLASFGTIMCLFLNRSAMYFALRTLTAIEAAITESRVHRQRGWIGMFTDLVPFSLFLPPGDLLGVALLLSRIRSNTDHLDERRYAIFRRAELAMGIGAVLQYVGFIMLILFMNSSAAIIVTGNVAVAMGFGVHVPILIGMACITWSLQSMQRELSGIVLSTQSATPTESPFSNFPD